MRLAKKWTRLAAACATLTLAGWGGAELPAGGTAVSASELKPDETVVLFDTAASLSPDGRHWSVPLHAWIHEPEDSRVRKAAVAAALRARYDLAPTPETQANFDRRVNLFFADNERGKHLRVHVAGQDFELPASEPNGHSRTELLLPREQVEEAQGDGLPLTPRVVLDAADDRRFSATVHRTPARGISVISDIDDTVKVTEVGDRRALLDHTFFQDFRPVPGMAAKYAIWAEAGARFHFVSSSPWQLYTPLAEFLDSAGFPQAVLHLKSVRFKDETLLDLFAPGTQTKPRQIEPILARFPERSFVLVGDSGEQDPEVYAALLRKHPEQVLRVYIRNVTDASPDDERFDPLFREIAEDRWTLFTDPGGLRLPRLRRLPTS